MSIKVGSNKACAACKYQRRKCSKECPLAPYFPSDKPKTFSNAHRLFGVCNITRILNHVKPHERDEAMKSIIFESDVRAKFPVEGCYGVTMYYNYLITKAKEELSYTKMLLANIKQHHIVMPLDPTMSLPPIPIDLCSISPTHRDEFPIYNHDQDSSFFDPNLGQVYDANDYMENNDIYMETSPCMSDIINDVNTSFLDEKSTSMSMDEPIALENNTHSMDTGSSEFNSSNHHKRDISEYYQDTTSFDEFGNNIRAFVDCKDACKLFIHCPDSILFSPSYVSWSSLSFRFE
ncbi:hypothetical protein Lal_00040393 [Lupinus albus]|nr:hypothetical protein Lal_00040393 [Lupinus albus]